MTAMARTILVLALATLTACKKDTQGFCNFTVDCGPGEFCDMPNHNCVSMSQIDGALLPCDVNEQCPASLPYCNVPERTCVQCGPGETSQCTGTMPVCSVDHVCQPCTTDPDCASGVCLASGACADTSNVIYAAVGGGSIGCTQTMPCDADFAVTQIAGPRNIVHFTPEVHDVDTLTVSMDATLIGRGATLNFSGAQGPVIRVAGASDVAVYFLELRNGDDPAADGDGIQCGSGSSVLASQVTIRNNDNAGIDGQACDIAVDRSTIMANAFGVRTDGRLTVTRSVIREQTQVGVQVSGTNARVDLSGSILYLNQGGGVQAQNNAEYGIENNIMTLNGGAGSGFGGANIDSNAGNNVFFRFNTVARNQAAVPAAGLRCNLFGAAASSNIFVGNAVEAVNCAVTFSLFDQTAMPSGNGNRSGDPGFVTIAAGNPFPAGYYRLSSATSPAVDNAEDLPVAIDIDGDDRPQGAARDIGADERVP
jgi:hypothetical protein